MHTVTKLDRLPEGVPLHHFQPPHNMWTIGFCQSPPRYFAYRPVTPKFVIEVSDPTQIEQAAGDILNRFLKRVNDIGIQSL
ncbi:hypothetical protein LAV_00124 [Sphingobium phage Lacusarx]|uniref:Uncharacterized protein n=1 Tax=Sphingobium phage Lacusarx TaxID=1980139 RepID=A0A1W6DX88_9CAUD|nr:hypothetical protein FDH44_gp179 [Sphingobium phage Lacusarx]ARK07499.1 hypothetical protein LAV_00124 [Sphingobium phage Lacusarx]